MNDQIQVSITCEKGSNEIIDLKVEASSQLAGRGKKCAEKDFTGQFIGKTGPFTLGVDIDAVSGATVTSQAVVEAVNSIYQTYAVSGDWQYTINDEGKAVVTRYLGSAAEIKMPWNLDGTLSAEIGEYAFRGNTRLRRIELPAAAYVIRANAFSGCSGLEEVKLPSLLETIEDGAFEDCTALKQIEIPDSVMELGENVFAANTTLIGSAESLASDYAAACGLQYRGYAEEAENPEKYYQYEIVRDYARITSYIGEESRVVVPAELGGYPVRVIGDRAFASRYSMEQLVIPEGVTELEKMAFYYCLELRTIEFPSTLQEIGSNAFEKCENLTEVKLPDGMTTLGSRAFEGCSQLQDVTIPASVKIIPYYTFFECHDRLTIHGPAGSAAERFAASRGYRFVAED